MLIDHATGDALERRGGDTPATNSTMEFMAAIAAIYAFNAEAPPHATLTILSDSEYLIKTATLWIPAWKRRGWQTAAGLPVKNLDLVQEVERLTKPGRITWRHVRGHSGVAGNERADVLAGEARKLVAAGADPHWERRCRWVDPAAEATIGQPV
jgi:ribonuclease HI